MANEQSESLGVASIIMIVKEQVSIFKRPSILGKAKSATRIAVGLLSCRKVRPSTLVSEFGAGQLARDEHITG